MAAIVINTSISHITLAQLAKDQLGGQSNKSVCSCKMKEEKIMYNAI